MLRIKNKRMYRNTQCLKVSNSAAKVLPCEHCHLMVYLRLVAGTTSQHSHVVAEQISKQY